MTRPVVRAAFALLLCGFGMGVTSCAPVAPEEDGAFGESGAEIVGGSTTVSYPAVGYMRYTIVGDSGFHFCTTTVIAPNAVLTAQHCVSDPGSSGFRVGFGTH